MLAGDTDDARATQKRKLNQSLLHRITGRAPLHARQARLHNGLEPLKCLVNAVTGEVESGRLSDKPGAGVTSIAELSLSLVHG